MIICSCISTLFYSQTKVFAYFHILSTYVAFYRSIVNKLAW